MLTYGVWSPRARPPFLAMYGMNPRPSPAPRRMGPAPVAKATRPNRPETRAYAVALAAADAVDDARKALAAAERASALAWAAYHATAPLFLAK